MVAPLFPAGPVVVATEDDETAADAVALGRRLADLIERPLDVRTVAGAAPGPAAVVVLGHGDRHRLGGSRARRLLQRSPCPIAVAPGLPAADRAGRRCGQLRPRAAGKRAGDRRLTADGAPGRRT